MGNMDKDAKTNYSRLGNIPEYGVIITYNRLYIWGDYEIVYGGKDTDRRIHPWQIKQLQNLGNRLQTSKNYLTTLQTNIK